MEAIKILFLSILCLSISACSSGYCRKKKDHNSFVEHAKDLPKFISADSKAGIKEEDLQLTRIFKYDGSLQCQQGKALSVKKMQSELERQNIKIYKAEKANDGMMHPQSCGSTTGNINVYDIQNSDLEKAIKLGYKKLP